MMIPLSGLGASVSDALQSAATTYNVPLPLLTAVATKESTLNPNAVGTKGEQGLMQLMPATQQQYGVTNPFDPQQSADAGARMLSDLYNQYGDWNTALIAYNEGSGNLASRGVFPVSQEYADSILAAAGPLAPSSTDGGASGATFDTSTSSGIAGIFPTVLVIGAAVAFGLILIARR